MASVAIEVDVLVFPSSAFASSDEQNMLPTQNALQFVRPVISLLNYPVMVAIKVQVDAGVTEAARFARGDRTDANEKVTLRAVVILLLQRDQQLAKLVGRGIRPGDIIFLEFGEIGAMVLSDNSLYYMDRHDVQNVRGGASMMLAQPRVISDMHRRFDD